MDTSLGREFGWETVGFGTAEADSCAVLLDGFVVSWDAGAASCSLLSWGGGLGGGDKVGSVRGFFATSSS